MTLQFCQQWTGINVISYYGTTLYSMMGFPAAQSSIELVLIGGVISFIPAIASLYLVCYFININIELMVKRSKKREEGIYL